jgi:hypothetical protein
LHEWQPSGLEDYLLETLKKPRLKSDDFECKNELEREAQKGHFLDDLIKTKFVP